MSAKVYDQAEYIGDAVYASFDGYHIWLTTGDGNDQRIALEPDVFRALVEYEARLRRKLVAQAAVNLHDAASIAYPFKDRDLDPPTTYWTDANERDYAAWLESRRAEMEHEFALDHDDTNFPAFDEFCRDRFEDECL